MEGNVVLYCPGCMTDKTFRYVRESAVEKIYECLDCETPQGMRKKPERKPVERGNRVPVRRAA